MLDELKALREKVNIEARNAKLKQFRADFEAVWDYWRASGQISEQELIEGRALASHAVSEHLGDAEWVACAMGHFRVQASAIEADAARAVRIRNEVRRSRTSPADPLPGGATGLLHPAKN